MADLITLEDYKEAEGISTPKDDLKLSALIPSVSQLVKTYCGNSFVDYYSSSKTETVNVEWDTYIVQLTESPIVSVTLVEERESYEEVQQRIDKIKEKYKALREQKINETIRERVANLGITIEETDDKATLLEKERIYSEERQKIEYALESFYRSAHSLCFQLNKRYIPKYLSIIRCVDKRFETGEIYIKWDESFEDEWLILIYIKNNSPDEGIVIEDKTDPEKNITYEFQPNEIFKASDIMVDALTKLLDVERNKRKIN